MVKKAIILAAGRGKRLRPFTDHTPKPMLLWNGRPTLDTILVALANMDVTEICLITHYLAAQIEAFVGDGTAWGLQTQFLQQKKLNGTATAVQQAAYFIDAPTLILAADYILPPTYLQDLHHAYQQNDVPIAVSLKKIPPEQLQQRSSVRLDSDGKTVLEIVEKPTAGQAPSQISASLIYIVPPQIKKYISMLSPSPRGEYELPTLINQMLQAGYKATGLLQPAPQEWQPT